MVGLEPHARPELDRRQAKIPAKPKDLELQYAWLTTPWSFRGLRPEFSTIERAITSIVLRSQLRSSARQASTSFWLACSRVRMLKFGNFPGSEAG